MPEVFEQLYFWLENVTGTSFYIAMATLMFTNSSLMVPPSEQVCCLCGIACANDKVDLFTTISICTIFNFLGTIPWYFLGRSHAKNRTSSLGLKKDQSGFCSKIVTLYTGQLEKIEQVYKKKGVWAVFLLRNVPVIRSICSYPAGRIKMPFAQFLFATILGIVVWVTIWVLLGFFAGAAILTYGLTIGTAIGITAFLCFYVALRRVHGNMITVD